MAKKLMISLTVMVFAALVVHGHDQEKEGKVNVISLPNYYQPVLDKVYFPLNSIYFIYTIQTWGIFSSPFCFFFCFFLFQYLLK